MWWPWRIATSLRNICIGAPTRKNKTDNLAIAILEEESITVSAFLLVGSLTRLELGHGLLHAGQGFLDGRHPTHGVVVGGHVRIRGCAFESHFLASLQQQ